MQSWKKRAIDYIFGLAVIKENDPRVIPFTPQKTVISGPETPYFKRVSPESVGISSKNIINMIFDLEEEIRANVHSLMVIKDGCVIAEMAAPGYSVNTSHLAYSMSKSLTGIAIGIAKDEGKLRLDERLCDVLPEYEYTDPRFADITIEHLLTMQSGVAFAELGSVSESEWTKAYFEGMLSFEPGQSFAYNSMNSYMLARIIERKYGVSLTEFLRPRIFEPLKITNYHWEVGPEGIEKGGWGLYMSAESWAKIGLMLLDGGVFEDKRILSEDFILKASERHSFGKREEGDFDYGYHLWVNKKKSDILFNGMLGQNVWICPKNNIIVSLNAGNNELFQESPAMAIIRKHLDTELIPRGTFGIFDYRLLKRYQRDFFLERGFVRLPKQSSVSFDILGKRVPPIRDWERICGSWIFANNNLSIMPLFVRVMQNNFLGGIEKISFKTENSELYFTFTEGNKDYTLKIGLGKIESTVLDINGEKYLISAIGAKDTDQTGCEVYKISFIFPELPNTRMLKISLVENDVMRFEFSELPNQKIAEKYIDTFESAEGITRIVFAALNRYLGEGFIERTLKETFNPTLSAVNADSPYTDIFLEGARRRQEDMAERMRLISSVIERVTHQAEEVEDTEKAEQSTEDKGGFIKSLINRIRKKGAVRADAEAAQDMADILAKDTLQLSENVPKELLPEAKDRDTHNIKNEE